MNSKIIFLLVMLFALSSFAMEPNAPMSNPDEICLFPKEPPVGMWYEKIRKVKEAKGVYGSVSEVLPGFLLQVQELGGNAVIHFAASQRFSILPWRIVSPIARGWAVKLANDKGLTCAEMGGKTIKEIMAPPQ